MGHFARAALVVRRAFGYGLIATGAGLSIAELAVVGYTASDVVVVTFVIVAAGLLGLDLALDRLVDLLGPTIVRERRRDGDGSDGPQADGNGN